MQARPRHLVRRAKWKGKCPFTTIANQITPVLFREAHRVGSNAHALYEGSLIWKKKETLSRQYLSKVYGENEDLWPVQDVIPADNFLLVDGCVVNDHGDYVELDATPAKALNSLVLSYFAENLPCLGFRVTRAHSSFRHKITVDMLNGGIPCLYVGKCPFTVSPGLIQS